MSTSTRNLIPSQRTLPTVPTFAVRTTGNVSYLRTLSNSPEAVSYALESAENDADGIYSYEVVTVEGDTLTVVATVTRVENAPVMVWND